jgi:L-threonylcarbamoyladenylate synthase
MTEKRKTPLDPKLLTRAKEMRHESAPAEKLIWSFLRDRQIGGYKFRRQTPLGNFIADFYCHEIDLVVELDGESHHDRTRRDRIRTEILQRDGHHVIRFWNNDVFDNLDAVLEEIYAQCEKLSTRSAQGMDPLSLRERVRVRGRMASKIVRYSAPPHPGPLPEGEGVMQAVKILRGGGVVAFPTETVYGLGADATNAAAVQRVFNVKGRPATNPVIVHIADANIAKRFAANWPIDAEKLIEKFWPGPLTIVLQKTDAIVPTVTAGRNTVGLRCPDHPLTLQLLREFDGAIIGPSANRSTHISPTTAQHVRDELGDAVDLILDGGPCKVGIESTVLDLSSDVPTILRPGAVSQETIESIIGPVQIFRGTIDTKTAAASPGMQPVHYAPITPTYRFERGDDSSLKKWIADHAQQQTIVLWLRDMPADAVEYARQLYATLRKLDEQSADAIWIEMPPDEPAWVAVRDRLLRASKPASA